MLHLASCILHLACWTIASIIQFNQTVSIRFEYPHMSFLDSVAGKYARFARHFYVTPKLPRRTVLVTGASRGIGLTIAFAFGIHRAKHIFLVGRNEKSLLEAAEIVSKGCRNIQSVHIKVGDVKNREFWRYLKEEKQLVSCTRTGIQFSSSGADVFVGRHRCSGECSWSDALVTTRIFQPRSTRGCHTNQLDGHHVGLSDHG